MLHPAPIRRFVVIGQRATASPEFLLSDIPGTSGRLDVLLRCVRAGLLVSHGLRGDAVMYLVLLGGALAPKTLKIDGSGAKYLRPDERSLAVTVKKALSVELRGDGFTLWRAGVSVADGGISTVLGEVGALPLCLLEEGAQDLRSYPRALGDTVFFLGDHLGFDPAAREMLRARGAFSLSVGPLSVQSDDVIAVVSNELDRRAQRVPTGMNSR